MKGNRTQIIRQIAQTPRYLKVHLRFNGRVQTVKYLVKYFNWSFREATIKINDIIREGLK